MKLILNPASSKPVFIDWPHTPHPPHRHNDITRSSPSKRSTSITTQPCRARTRGRCGCATIARPGGPSPLSAVLWWATATTTAAASAVSSRLSTYTSVLLSSVVSVARRPPLFYSSSCTNVSRVFRYNRALPRPSGRWQPRVKGCRTAARVKLCEGARTCVRTR